MVNIFFQGTIDFNGFSMVLKILNHHHWMFLKAQPLVSMVFRWAMVKGGFEVNNDLDVQVHLNKFLD